MPVAPGRRSRCFAPPGTSTGCAGLRGRSAGRSARASAASRRSSGSAPARTRRGPGRSRPGSRCVPLAAQQHVADEPAAPDQALTRERRDDVVAGRPLGDLERHGPPVRQPAPVYTGCTTCSRMPTAGDGTDSSAQDDDEGDATAVAIVLGIGLAEVRRPRLVHRGCHRGLCRIPGPGLNLRERCPSSQPCRITCAAAASTTLAGDSRSPRPHGATAPPRRWRTVHRAT